jgi:hypothetical protein
MRRSEIKEPTKPYGVRHFSVPQREKIRELSYRSGLNGEEVLFKALNIGLPQLEPAIELAERKHRVRLA